MKTYRRVGPNLDYPLCIRCNKPVNTDKPGYTVCRGNYQHIECMPMFTSINLFMHEYANVSLYTTQSLKEIVKPALESTHKQWEEARAERERSFWARIPNIDFILKIDNIRDNDVLTSDLYPDKHEIPKQILILEQCDKTLSFEGYVRDWERTSLTFVVYNLTDKATQEYTGLEIYGDNILCRNKKLLA
jgi:hypothetical protein